MKEKQFFPKAFAYTTRRIMPVNGFDGHEQRKAYRNHHMPACVTISGRHARKIRPPQVRPLQPAPRSEHTFFRRLIMVHNNKLAQAISYPNTRQGNACASFFGMAVSTTGTLHMVAMPTILAVAKTDSNTHPSSAAAPILGLHRRPSEYPPRRRVGHHKSCGNTNIIPNVHTNTVFPHSFLG